MAPNFLDFSSTQWLDAMAADYRHRGLDVRFEPFFYGAEWLPIAGSGTSEVERVVQIDNDADFLITAQTFSSFNSATGANIATPNVLVRMILDASQRFLQSGQTHLLNIFGTGQYPHLYLKPLRLAARSSFRALAQNLDTASMNLRLIFAGVKAIPSRL